MSMEFSPERVCYVQCNYCNTILAVSVPYGSMLISMVTVRCGHCSNLLSVSMGLLLHSLHLQDFQMNIKQLPSSSLDSGGGSSCSRWNRFGPLHGGANTDHNYEQPMLPPIRPPEKRQRVPSAYNRFIKDEIQRIKVSNPEISHREAFSTAAKNWAHFPHIHFGLKLDGNNKEENSVAGKGAHKSLV